MDKSDTYIPKKPSTDGIIVNSDKPQDVEEPEVWDLYAKSDLRGIDDEANDAEQLKKLAYSDALRAYRFIRLKLEKLSNSGKQIFNRLSITKLKQNRWGTYFALSISTVLIGAGYLSRPQNPAQVLSNSSINQEASILEDGVQVSNASFDSTPITLTKQPRPESLNSDTDVKMGLRQMAGQLKSVNTTEFFTVHGSAITVNHSSGEQTTIFTFGDTLYIARTLTELSLSQWQNYIAQIQ